MDAFRLDAIKPDALMDASKPEANNPDAFKLDANKLDALNGTSGAETVCFCHKIADKNKERFDLSVRA